MRKHTINIIFISIFFLLLASPALTADKQRVLVLPFSVHSAENIDYVKQGVSDMLSSRIAASNQIEVVGKDLAQEELAKYAKAGLSASDMSAIAKKLGADFVVWGSITKFGQSISIDGKLLETASGKSELNFFSQSQTIDDVIPKMNDFAQKIVGRITGASALQPLQTASGTPSPSAPAPSRESQIIAGMKDGGKRATLTSVINPEFINSPDPLKRKGFWMSQQFRTEFKGMAVGDVNRDGLNEIVVIDQSNIHIYQKKGEAMQLLQTIAGKRYQNYISVDVADINRDGIPEIIVTCLNRNLLESFVIQYKDGQYVTIASNLRWFLRVINTASDVPILLGQTYGSEKVFDTQIYEIVWRNGKYVEGEKQKIPRGLSVYGLTFESLTADGSEKIIALDELDYLCVFEKTHKLLIRLFTFGFAQDEVLWRSDTPYGGSNNFIANTDRNNPSDTERSAFANLRILSYDTNNDGKKEFIIVKNLSSVGRLFKNLKMFTSSEIYNLEWDGLGLAENWRTKKINGYVADYAIADVNNDGKPEVVLALVLSVGAALSDRSVVVIYEFETEQ